MNRDWDFGADAQQAGEDRLEAYFLDDGECVCPTCVVREVLTAAWPILREGVFAEARAFYLGEGE